MCILKMFSCKVKEFLYTFNVTVSEMKMKEG